MPVYHYKAKKKNGEKVSDSVSLGNESEVRLFLRQKGLRPIEIKKESIFNKNIDVGSAISTKDLAVMTRLLAVMNKSGVPLLQALHILARGEKNVPFKKKLQSISESISAGNSFWEALNKHKEFSRLYVHLVRSGEVGGNLSDVLERLAVYMEKDLSIRNKVKGAMIYPSIILIVCLLVIVGFIVFIVPKFKEMIESSGGEMPVITKVIIGISDLFTGNMLAIIGSLGVFFIAIFLFKNSNAGKRLIDTILLKGPIISNLTIKSATARFLRTMSTMLSSGVDIIDSVNICKMTFDNVLLEEVVSQVSKEVSEGSNMSVPLAKSKVFPDMMIQMINVGEETGRVSEVMDKVADFYEEEVDITINAFTKLVEPLILVVLGGTIGVMFIGMYMPIFQAAGHSAGV